MSKKTVFYDIAKNWFVKFKVATLILTKVNVVSHLVELDELNVLKLVEENS